MVDVRDEESVAAAVESAVVKFGGLDILVNNASAIALKGTLELDMKRLVTELPRHLFETFRSFQPMKIVVERGKYILMY